jgi:hypothetical protein
MGWPRFAVSFLGAILVLEALWLIVQAVRPLPGARAPLEAVSTMPSDEERVPAPSPEIPSVADSAARPLFSPGAPSAGGESAVPRAALSGSAKLIGSRLTLTGVVSGDPPQAIIEDTQTQKTYFLVAGQAIEDAVLEQVMDDRVILDLHGEKIELSL